MATAHVCGGVFQSIVVMYGNAPLIHYNFEAKREMEKIRGGSLVLNEYADAKVVRCMNSN